MEFLTAQEAAAYRMLRQVLQNHLTTHAMTFLTVLGAVGSFLGDLCLAWCMVGAETQTLVPQTMTRLRPQLLRRLEDGTARLVMDVSPEDEDLEAQRVDPYAHVLRDVLLQLLSESGEEQGVTWEGAWRVAVSLAADIVLLVVAADRDPDAVAGRLMDGLYGGGWSGRLDARRAPSSPACVSCARLPP